MSSESYLPNPGRRASRTRSWAVGFVGAFMLCVAAYAAWWWFLADRLRTGIEDWRTARIAEGVEVGWSNLAIEGFPGVVRASIADPMVAIPAAWRWEAVALSLGIDPLDPGGLAIEAWGRHAIDIIRGDAAENVEITAARLDGRIATLADALVISLDLGDAEVRRNGEPGGRLDDMSVTLRRFAPVASDPQALNPPPAYDMALDLTTEMAEVPDNWPFKERTQHMALNARLLGDLAVPLNRDHVTAWRDLGGVLEIDRFALDIGTLAFSGDGTVSVDRGLQPVGALAVRLRGFDKLIDALVLSGELAAKDAGFIKGILNLVARIDPATGENVIDAGFTVQDRKLYLGPFELGEVPPVVWPD